MPVTKKNRETVEHIFYYRLETAIEIDCEDKENGKEYIAGKLVCAETENGSVATK